MHHEHPLELEEIKERERAEKIKKLIEENDHINKEKDSPDKDDEENKSPVK